MIQEFYISVTPVGGNEYLVRTEKVSPGVPLAEEQFVWPVEEWLAQAQHLMNDPVLSLLQTGGVNPFNVNASQPSPTFSALGQQLYNLLFQGTIRDSWMTAQGIAHHRREGLRLRLGLKGTQLPCLPWEVLHAGNRSIATGTDIVFSRYQPTFTPMALALPFRDSTPRSQTAHPLPPLKILMILAVPSDQESLELKREVAHLQEELYQPARTYDDSLEEVPKLELTLLEQPDREQLTQALEQGQYQVLHYAGHSNLAASGGALYLVSRKTGLTEVLSGDDLAGLLVNNGIRMAVFNSCRGADTATGLGQADAHERSLAEALVRRGIPAVLAMAERIPNDVALTLTRLFYRNLKQGAPVDLSVSRARQGLVSAYGSQQLYWALPVLYMHPEFDGSLTSHTFRNENGIDWGIHSSHLPPGKSVEVPSTSGSQVSQVGRAGNGSPLRPVPSNGAVGGTRVNGKHPILETEPANSPPSTPSVRSNVRGQEVATTLQPNTTTLSEEEEADLSSLIDDLVYSPNSESLTQEETPSVSDLIRQLSTAEDDEPLDPSLTAPRSESLLPEDTWGGAQYLEIPANPRDEGIPVSSASVSLPPFSLSAEVFQGRQWKVKDFIRVRCVSVSQWQEIVLASIPSVHTGSPRKNPSRPLSSSGSIAPSSQPSPAPSSSHSTPSRQGEEPRPRQFRVAPLLAGVVITAIGVMGVRFFPVVQERLGSLLTTSTVSPSPQTSPTAHPSTSPTITPDPQNNEKGKGVEQALHAFQQGKPTEGIKAIENLLDHSAFADAEQVFRQLSPTQADTPEVNFLRGRLIMQAVKAGNSSYKLRDAQKYLEAAAYGKRDVVRYSDALGFFFYAIGEYDQANQAFGLSLLRDARDGTVESQVECEGIYTSCAGLALVVMKSAQKFPDAKQNLIQQAVYYRKQVLSERPQDFQPEVLEKHWMWSKQAIEDWRSLLKVRTPNPTPNS